MTMFPNLNSLLALPTLIAALTSLGLQEGAVLQGRSKNQGLSHDKGPQLKLLKHPPKPGNNIPLSFQQKAKTKGG